MQLSLAMAGLETAVETQLRLAGPEAAEAGAQFMSALLPAIRESMMDVVSMAAAEVSSQLPDNRVEIRLVEGEPELVISDEDSTATSFTPQAENDNEARITLRLPGYLKDLIAEAADNAGDSVNSYVVESLNTATTRSKKGGATRHRTTIEL